MKTRAVKNRRIAWLLRKEGFHIKSVEPNRNKPEFDVYIFEATPELCMSLDRHIRNNDGRKQANSKAKGELKNEPKNI